MIVEHNSEKLKNAVIYFLNNTKYCGNTKLAKLLFYLDFEHFKQTGKSVTGLEYKAYKFGPYPQEFMSKLSNNQIDYVRQEKKESGFNSIMPTQKIDTQYFTKRELQILENCAYIFGNTKADQMVKGDALA